MEAPARLMALRGAALNATAAYAEAERAYIHSPHPAPKPVKMMMAMAWERMEAAWADYFAYGATVGVIENTPIALAR